MHPLSWVDNFDIEDEEQQEYDKRDPDFPFAAMKADARALYLDRVVPRIPVPEPLEFYREYVSKNRPCIITGAIDSWKALSRWKDPDYLRNVMNNAEVTVEVTPNGRGDSVVDDKYFVKPESRRMRFNDFLDALLHPDKTDFAGIPYLSQQNSNFKSGDFDSLWADIDVNSLEWAREAIGQPEPDAINIWIGDHRAVTSLHKDHYENMYAVITGEKHFMLFPPTDLHCMYYSKYTQATYREKPDSKGEFEVSIDEPVSENWWIPIDADNPDLTRYPRFAESSPVLCAVRPGEVLYLPSMWFHRVAQTGPMTIAVNFWYDMQYDIKFVYYNFMENVIAQRIAAQAQQGRLGE